MISAVDVYYVKTLLPEDVKLEPSTDSNILDIESDFNWSVYPSHQPPSLQATRSPITLHPRRAALSRHCAIISIVSS